MKRSFGTAVILAVVFALSCCPEGVAQPKAKASHGTGTISGRIHILTCPPWDGIPQPGKFLGVMARSGSTNALMDTIKRCCCPAQPKCPGCSDCPQYDSTTGQYVFKYSFSSLTPNDYQIVLFSQNSADSLSQMTVGQITVLAYARKSHGFGPDQADSSAARVISIDAKQKDFTNVDIYYAQGH